MERFVRGDVIVIPFPFSDLTQAKRRPALVLSVLPGYDLILCQITSQEIQDMYAVILFPSSTTKSFFIPAPLLIQFSCIISINS